MFQRSDSMGGLWNYNLRVAYRSVLAASIRTTLG